MLGLVQELGLGLEEEGRAGITEGAGSGIGGGQGWDHWRSWLWTPPAVMQPLGSPRHPTLLSSCGLSVPCHQGQGTAFKTHLNVSCTCGVCSLPSAPFSKAGMTLSVWMPFGLGETPVG